MAALGGAAVFRLVFGATAQFRFGDFTIRATSLDAEGSTLQVRVWDSEFRRKVFMRRKAQTFQTCVFTLVDFFCFVVGALLVVFSGFGGVAFVELLAPHLGLSSKSVSVEVLKRLAAGCRMVISLWM